MPFPLIRCDPHPFTIWLLVSALGVVALAVETGALAVAARRRGWGAPVALAVAALAAAGLAFGLWTSASHYESAVASHAPCSANATFQVTFADASRVLDAYGFAGQLFGAIIGLVVFGSLITVASLVARKRVAGPAS